MALTNIIPLMSPQLTSLGTPLAGGTVTLTEPGTNTPIPSFQDSKLIQSHTQPVKLSGSGRANIWITQDCDLRVFDKNGNLILQSLNANPDAIGFTEEGGLIPNGSFEIDTDLDGLPNAWVVTNDAGSTNLIDTSTSTDGAQSFQFLSTGTGGGTITTENFFPVNDVDTLRVNTDIISSVAAVRNIVRIEWYDVSQIAISDSDPYDSTANPVVWTSLQLDVNPPPGARFAKLKLIGIDPSVALAGTTNFDRCSVFYAAVVQGIFDNITIQGNEIITTNTNGQLELTPDGTGPVNITHTDEPDLVDVENALNIGSIDPTNNQHAAFGPTIIQSKSDATTAAAININSLGGDVLLGAQTGTGRVHAYFDGKEKWKTQQRGVTVFGDLDNTPVSGGAQDAIIFLTHASDSAATAIYGFDSTTTLFARNLTHGGDVEIGGETAGGVASVMLRGRPSAHVSLNYNGIVVAQTATAGNGGLLANNTLTGGGFERVLTLSDLSAGDFVGPAGATDEAIVRFDGATGKLGQNSAATISNAGQVIAPSHLAQVAANFVLMNEFTINMRNQAPQLLMFETDAPLNEKYSDIVPVAGQLRFRLANDSAGDVNLWLTVDRTDTNPDLVTVLADNFTVSGKIQTLAATSGGLQVNNTLTGGGFERVLTTSDSTGASNVVDITDGIAVKDPALTTPTLEFQTDAAAVQASIIATNAGMTITQLVNGQTMTLAADDTGGTLRSLLVADPDADIKLYQAGLEVLRTLTAAAGGVEANNTLTGAGFERVLTTSDGGVISSSELLFASGARIKYGIDVNTGGGVTRQVTFPSPFPNNIYFAHSIPWNTAGAGVSTRGNVDSYNTANMMIGSATVSGGGTATAAQAIWIAIGD